MKSLRLVLAAATLAVAVAPAVASAGIQCRLYDSEQQVGPVTVWRPECAW